MVSLNILVSFRTALLNRKLCTVCQNFNNLYFRYKIGQITRFTNKTHLFKKVRFIILSRLKSIILKHRAPYTQEKLQQTFEKIGFVHIIYCHLPAF